MNDLRRLQRRIDRIKARLSALGDMRPGSLSKQYNVCGNPACRCKDKTNPRKHGPYYQLSYVHKGKSTTEFVAKDRVKHVRQEIRNFRLFRQLTQDWVATSVMMAKERKKKP